jgi:Phosphotransferase enzyme family
MSVPASSMAELAAVPHGRTARRITWPHLPREVRHHVEGRLAEPVETATSMDAGFTPGFASRLLGTGGARLFVKAASLKAQRPFAEAYLEEARVTRALPTSAPTTELLWTDEVAGWVVLGFRDVDGRRPRRPWRRTELDLALSALTEVAAMEPPASLSLQPLWEDLPAFVTGWQSVRGSSPGWPHLDEAAALAGRLPDLPDSGHLNHCDARDDNILLADGKALLCDWNWPALGPKFLDAVMLLVSFYGDGGDADAVLAQCPLTHDVPAEHIDMWLAGFCGFMLEARERPVPPSSPYLRVHNSWYGEAAWAWLSQRRGWS